MLLSSFILFLITLLAGKSRPESDITQPITPKVSWSNLDIEVPKIIIFFKSDFVTKNPLTNPWLKISLPWLSFKMNAQWAVLPTSSCSTDSLVFSPTVEERTAADEVWTTYYIQMTGATYTPGATFALKFEPDRYMDFEGYSDALRIAYVSKNVDGHIKYAYNNAFTMFYAVKKPSFDIIVNDYTTDSLRTQMNQIITSEITLQIKDGLAERLVIKAAGDYTFADDAEIKCTTLTDPLAEIVATPRDDYECKFFQEIGGKDQNFLAYTWKKGKIPGGQYKLSFTLKTPEFGGYHKITVYAMDRTGPRIHTIAETAKLFETVPNSWSPGYPRITFSFGLSATDTSLPLGLGLYSMTKGFNQVFNSIVFEFKAFEPIPSIPSGESFEIQVQLGTTAAVVPLGYVFHDLTSAPGSPNILKSYKEGVLSFKNVLIFNGKIYKISAKVGFPEPENLPKDADTGFAFISLIYKDKVVFKSQAVFKPGFSKIIDNQNLLTNAYVKDKDTLLFKRHRGMTAFRSSPTSSAVGADYEILSDRHGLRKGDGQEFFMQSSIGPNHLFYTSDLEPATHDSSKTYLEVITSKSISSKTTSWADKFKTQNCKIFNAKYDKWMTQIDKIDAQNEVSSSVFTITTEPADYYFIGGCVYKEVIGTRSRYSRFRFRMDDKAYVDQDGNNRSLKGYRFAFMDNLNVKDIVRCPNCKRGNTFVWRNVDIGSYPSEVNFGEADSIILDAYVLAYFFSSTDKTEEEIVASPSVTTMDNMYVIGDNDVSFPTASIKFSPQLSWLVNDPAATAPNLKVNGNDGRNWPNMMHIHGTMGTLPDNTYAIKIFFDFVEPLTKDKDSDIVDCSVLGITVQRCEFRQGVPDLGVSRYLDHETNENTVYSYNSRLAHSLLLYIDPSSVTAGVSTFSVVFPFRFLISSNLDKMNFEHYTNQVYATPGVVILDNTFSPLDYIDFGNGGVNYGVPVYHPDNYIASYTGAEIPAAQVAKLDDAAPNDNPDNSVWLDITPASSKVGGKTSFDMKANCAACTPVVADYNFGAAMACGDWNFSGEGTFALDNNQTDVRKKCHNIKYYFNGVNYGLTSKDKWCMYCPGADTVAAPGNDANALQFSVTDFTLPNYSGLVWPSDLYTVLGGTKITSWMQMKGLTKNLTPNTLTLTANTVTIKQSQFSFVLQLAFDLFNPLPKESSIFLELQVSSELILRILGEDQKPPCYARQSLTTNFKCEYSIVSTGIRVDILEAVPKGPLEFRLYGVSSQLVTSVSNGKFVVTSYLDQVGSPLLKIDETLALTLLTFNYQSPDPPGSIGITLAELDAEFWQSKAYGDISFRVNIAGRDLNENDFISLNLGAGAISEIPEQINCIITDNNHTVILEQAAICNTENLDDVQVKFEQDLNIREFYVHLRYLQMPEYTTPGIIASFKFNGDFTAFKSAQLPYGGVTNFPSMEVPPILEVKLDGKGQRSDLVLTITPNSNIIVQSVIFLQFNTDFSPNLSIFSIFSFQESDKQMLRSWIAGPRLLAVTGWLFAIDAKRPYKIRITGIDTPAIINSRSVQIAIADETGLAITKEWAPVTIGEAFSSSDISLIFVDSITYDEKIIRVKSGITLRIFFERRVSRFITFAVIFDYLSNEVFKTFNPVCTLYQEGKPESNLVTSCVTLGHRLDMVVLADLEVGIPFILRITDMPNPDFGFCEPIPLRIIVSNAQQTKTLLVSSTFVNNMDKSPFTNKPNTKILNFVSIPEGYLEVWRGFYEIVYAGPAASTPGERLFYTDRVSYTLSYDLDGLVASTPISFYGINDFQSDIGESRSPFIIGASTNTVTTNYILYILRAESFSQQYTELPLLNIKVLPNKAKFLVPSLAKVFKGASSLPIELIPEKLPLLETFFDVTFVESNTEGLAFADDLKEFSISTNDPLFFLTVTSNLTTALTTATIRIKPQNPASPFLETLVNLSIVPKTGTADPNLVVAFRDVTKFSMKVDFASDQPLYILYYLAPDYAFSSYSRTTLEAWVKKGITRTGDTFIGYAIINDSIDPETREYKELLSETTYKLKAYYSSPQSQFKAEKEANVTTLNRNLRNGEYNFNFKDPLFSARKRNLLCRISIKYGIPSEDLWSEDGLNCRTDLMPNYISQWHTRREKLINDTSAEYDRLKAGETTPSTNSTNSTSNSTAGSSLSTTEASTTPSAPTTDDPSSTTTTTTTATISTGESGGVADTSSASSDNSTSNSSSNDTNQTEESTETKIRIDLATFNITELFEPLSKMRIFVFGSRREFQPDDIYNILFEESRFDNAIDIYNKVFENSTTVTTIDNLIRLHLSKVPAIEGELKASITANATSFEGVKLTENGFLLAVYAPSEVFSSSVTKSDIKDVNSYNEFYYEYFEKGKDITFNFTTGFVPNTTYSAYILASNDDPRSNALTSELKKVEFKTPSSGIGSFSQIFGARMVSLLLILYIFIFVSDISLDETPLIL